MADVATLGLRIRRDGLVEAITDLDKLTISGKRVETQANRINSSLLVLAQQATGANPVIARLAATLGSMGIGSPLMVGVLGGVAALGLAWRALTREAREAREEHEKLIQKLAEAYDARQKATTQGMKETQDGLVSSLSSAAARERAGGRAGWDPIGLGMRLFAGNADDELKALREHNLQRGERMVKDQTIQGIASKTADEIKRQADEAERLARAQLQAYAAASSALAMRQVQGEIAAEAYTRAEILSERRRTGRLEVNRGFGPEFRDRINVPGSINRRITKDPAPSGGGANWGQAGMIAGGMLLGTGLAGDGYAAAGLGGGMSLAAQGAMLGSVVPVIGTAVGAVVGGVAGLVSGLIGHSKRAREEAEQMRLAQRQFDLNIQARRAAAGGNGDMADELRRVAANERELAEARKAGMSKVSIETLKAVQAEEALVGVRRREADIIKDLEEKWRRAGKEAEEVQETRKRETIAWYEGERDWAIRGQEEQRRILQEQLDVSREQLHAQERTVESLRQVHESLATYSRSLVLGAQSPLSPFSQLGEARSQFETMRALAMGGDITAGHSLSGSARSLLEASRGYHASGPGYVSDFQRVQESINAVRDRFGRQLTIEEQIRNELQRQTGQLETQINKIGDTIRAIQQNTVDVIGALQLYYNPPPASDPNPMERPNYPRDRDAIRGDATRMLDEELEISFFRDLLSRGLLQGWVGSTFSDAEYAQTLFEEMLEILRRMEGSFARAQL